MSSKSPNRRASASASERERRAAAKAKRQSAKANPGAGVAADVPVREVNEEAVVSRKSAPAGASGNARKETKGATLVADPGGAAIPMGDQNGMVAAWMMFALLVLLALLAIAVAAAS